MWFYNLLLQLAVLSSYVTVSFLIVRHHSTAVLSVLMQQFSPSFHPSIRLLHAGIKQSLLHNSLGTVVFPQTKDREIPVGSLPLDALLYVIMLVFNYISLYLTETSQDHRRRNHRARVGTCPPTFR